VAAKHVDSFQTVQAKQSIVRLLDVSRIEVTVQIPESLISLIPQVKKVACRFDAFPNREFFGQVTKIGSEAWQTTRTYPVTVQIDQPSGGKPSGWRSATGCCSWGAWLGYWSSPSSGSVLWSKCILRTPAARSS
jgi:hypothetical protein